MSTATTNRNIARGRTSKVEPTFTSKNLFFNLSPSTSGPLTFSIILALFVLLLELLDLGRAVDPSESDPEFCLFFDNTNSEVSIELGGDGELETGAGVAEEGNRSKDASGKVLEGGALRG